MNSKFYRINKRNAMHLHTTCNINYTIFATQGTKSKLVFHLLKLERNYRNIL